MKRITTRLKKETLITMPDWPTDKCTEMPERLEGTVSIKRRKRRVINLARKFHAVLDKGMLMLYVKKKTGILPNPEFQIDLAKTTVMYDEKRIILIFKTANESYVLIPLEDTLDHWKDAICKHRLHRQEAVGKGLQPDTNVTNVALEALTTKSSDDKAWESQAGMRLFDEVHQLQSLTLEVLERLTKTYEEMNKTSEEMKQALKNFKDAIAKPSGTERTETTSAGTSRTTSVTPSNISTLAMTLPSTTADVSTRSSELPTDSKFQEASEDEEDDSYDSTGTRKTKEKKK